MKIIHFMIVVLIAISCTTTKKETLTQDGFTFAFLTDLHVQPELKAGEGMKKALLKVNELHPDFVLTGGDLIMDALKVSHERADSLYALYKENMKLLDIPVYNTIGNHEYYGLKTENGADTANPDFAENMYKRLIGDNYYSFNYKGWHFMVLDAMDVDTNTSGGYTGNIDTVQLEWIKKDLQTVDAKTPIAISTHIPFISTWAQYTVGAHEALTPGAIVTNAKEILDLFNGHNLKLVMQGHLHYFEHLYINNKTHFITGGAVSSKWWHGPTDIGMEEGFTMVKIQGEDVECKYIDYGWDAQE